MPSSIIIRPILTLGCAVLLASCGGSSGKSDSSGYYSATKYESTVLSRKEWAAPSKSPNRKNFPGKYELLIRNRFLLREAVPLQPDRPFMAAASGMNAPASAHSCRAG